MIAISSKWHGRDAIATHDYLQQLGTELNALYEAPDGIQRRQETDELLYNGMKSGRGWWLVGTEGR
jgi:hypothetical protein